MNSVFKNICISLLAVFFAIVISGCAQKKFSGHYEVRAGHIMTNSKEKAETIIALLNKGADFEWMARNASLGPSSQNGGDLGYFTPGQMLQDFWDGTTDLDIGEHSPVPVKVGNQWHVIKVYDRRPVRAKESTSPSFFPGLPK